MLNPTPSTTVQISAPQFVATLEGGQSYGGVVRAQGDSLVAQIGRLQIPLDGTSDLVPGQRILVQVQKQPDGLQLTIRPQAGAPPAPAPDLATLLKPILQNIGRSDFAQRLPALLPRQTPETASVLQALVSSLLSERGTGRDIQLLQQFVSGATNQGVLPPGIDAALSPWLALTALADAVAWEALVRRARSERNAAARLAQTLQGGSGKGTVADLQNSLGSLTRRLLGDQAFQSWLRNQGTLDEFNALGERILERAAGKELQNLRALDQAYQFLELPLSAASGFRRLQLHNFSERGGAADKGAGALHRAVLDLETTQLGPVWIDLRAQGVQCSCQFRLVSPELVESVEAGAEELEEDLMKLGYGSARVTAATWDGNREQALLALLAPFQSLDLEA